MSIYDQFSEREQKILQERATRVAAASQDGEDDDLITAQTVQIGAETYVLPIEELTAVYVDISIIPLPCVPDYVGGIANIRGHILPVLEFRKLLDVAGDPEAESNALVVVAKDNVTIAFRVDEIGDVTNFSKSSISELTEKSGARWEKYLQGVLPDGKAVIDVESIFNDASLIIDEIVS